MKTMKTLFALALCVQSAMAATTLPVKGQLVKPSNPAIEYVGRISFQNPESPAFRFPGAQMNMAFEGTSLKMLCKPKSGYFMVQIDEAEPFKVAFMGERPTQAKSDGEIAIRQTGAHYS